MARTRSVTIGSVAEISLKAARDLAAVTLLSMRQGEDPKADRRGGGAMTRVKGRPSMPTCRPPTCVRSQHRLPLRLKRYLLAPGSHRPLSSITAEMVEFRTRMITAEVAASGREEFCRLPPMRHTGPAGALGLRRRRDAYSSRAHLYPVRRLKRLWHEVARRERLVKADELPRFYRAVMQLPNPIQRDYLLLLLFTGLRRTEAATLTWDLSFRRGGNSITGGEDEGRKKLDPPMTDIVRGPRR